VSNDLHKRVERVLLETLGKSHENVAKAIVRDVLEDERKPLHSDDVWQTKLDAAERDRESILRRYKQARKKLDALHHLSDAWFEMARDEDDPAVAVARKRCAADLRALLEEDP